MNYDLSFIGMLQRKIEIFPVGPKREESLQRVRDALTYNTPQSVSQIAKKARRSEGNVGSCLEQLKSYGEVEKLDEKGPNNATMWIKSA